MKVNLIFIFHSSFSNVCTSKSRRVLCTGKLEHYLFETLDILVLRHFIVISFKSILEVSEVNLSKKITEI